MEMNEEKVISRIIQIRNYKKFTKKDVADKLKISEATYSRIESGKIALSYSHLANIAIVFDMSVVDIITYPKQYIEDNNNNLRVPKVTLQIELEDNIKADVIKLAFGDRVLEIKNI